MNNEKKLLLFTAIALIITMSSLAWIERKQSSFVDGKDWWSISFVDPSSSNADVSFIIENFSNQNNFTYEITPQEGPSESKSVTIPKGESRTISSQRKTPVTIEVTSNNETKSIYK